MRWSDIIWLKSISLTVASTVRQLQLKLKCIVLLNRELGYEFQSSCQDTALVTGEQYCVPSVQNISGLFKETTDKHLPFNKWHRLLQH